MNDQTWCYDSIRESNLNRLSRIRFIALVKITRGKNINRYKSICMDLDKIIEYCFFIAFYFSQGIWSKEIINLVKINCLTVYRKVFVFFFKLSDNIRIIKTIKLIKQMIDLVYIILYYSTIETKVTKIN